MKNIEKVKKKHTHIHRRVKKAMTSEKLQKK